MSVKVSKAEDHLAIKFDYSPDRIGKIKSIKGSYLNHLKCFSSFVDKNLDSIDNQDVRRYLLFLLEEKKTSHSYANQTISAIKFLCNDTLKQGRVIEAIPRPKRENKLPNVLSFDEVKMILNALENQKHKTILFLVYSAGLRVGEVVQHTCLRAVLI
jgi:integrase/recombinase XerD